MDPDEIQFGQPRWQAFGFPTREAFVAAYGGIGGPATPPDEPGIQGVDWMPLGVTSPAGGGGAHVGLTPEQSSAKAIINRALSEFGLGALGEWAWSTYLNLGNVDQVMLDLRQRPEYTQRFAGMKALADKGRAISEAQYIDLERTYAQLYRAAGLPASFYDQPEDFASLIGGEVAPTELRDRLQMASTAAFSAPQEVRDELSRLYGVDQGALTAYYLDPSRALPLLQQQFAAGTMASASRRAGYGALSREEAERLASLGLSEDAAARGFGELARSSELFGPLPGSGEQGIDRGTQLGVLEGNAAAIARLNKRAEERRAAFGGGGGFASDRAGVSGLASAAS